MKKKLLFLCYTLAVLCCTTSCKDKFKITANSSSAAIEGKTLYLRVFDNGKMVDVDSAQVIHGRFAFQGTMDSTTMACIFMDNDLCLLPVVLEKGEIKLTLNDAMQMPSGTPLNDTLASFIRQKAALETQMAELSRMESQMVMDGMKYDSVVVRLSHEADVISAKSDRLITNFISKHYDNVLGAGVFMVLTSNFPYPILNPQIEAVLGMGTPYFLENPYVKEYVRIAKENMEKIREKEQ